jgi:hypothetical protein
MKMKVRSTEILVFHNISPLRGFNNWGESFYYHNFAANAAKIYKVLNKKTLQYQLSITVDINF